MTRIRADNNDDAELAHPRVSASSAVLFFNLSKLTICAARKEIDGWWC